MWREMNPRVCLIDCEAGDRVDSWQRQMRTARDSFPSPGGQLTVSWSCLLTPGKLSWQLTFSNPSLRWQLIRRLADAKVTSCQLEIFTQRFIQETLLFQDTTDLNKRHSTLLIFSHSVFAIMIIGEPSSFAALCYLRVSDSVANLQIS